MESQIDQEFSKKFHKLITGPRRDSMVSLLKRGVSRNELPQDIDIEALTDMILGASWYSYLIRGFSTEERYITSVSRIIQGLSPAKGPIIRSKAPGSSLGSH